MKSLQVVVSTRGINGCFCFVWGGGVLKKCKLWNPLTEADGVETLSTDLRYELMDVVSTQMLKCASHLAVLQTIYNKKFLTQILHFYN
jgi:hypothetical protein